MINPRLRKSVNLMCAVSVCLIILSSSLLVSSLLYQQTYAQAGILPSPTVGTAGNTPTVKGTPVAVNAIAISLLVSPTSGPVGTTVTVTGTGFAASSTITIKYDGVAQTTSPSTITTTTTGSFKATFKVPASTVGPHIVTATDASSNSASKTFTVKSSISLSLSGSIVGKTITVSGAGFAASSTVTITFDGVAQTTLPSPITTDATGSFKATFTVPASTAGLHTVKATDASSNSASRKFTVFPSISLSPSTGPVGTSVTVSGAGFAAGSTVAIKYDGVAQTTSPSTITTDATGSFSATFTVPASTAGPHTVTATDASAHSASRVFKVI